MWLGQQTLSLLERCRLFRVPFIERFHCSQTYVRICISYGVFCVSWVVCYLVHLLCLGHGLLPHDRLALCECCLPLAEGGVSGQEGDTAVGDNDGSSRLDVGGTHRRGKDYNVWGAYTDVYTHYIRTYIRMCICYRFHFMLHILVFCDGLMVNLLLYTSYVLTHIHSYVICTYACVCAGIERHLEQPLQRGSG